VREVWITKDEPGGRVEPSEMRVDQGGKGFLVALPSTLQDLASLHDRLAGGTASIVVLDRVWRLVPRLGFYRSSTTRSPPA